MADEILILDAAASNPDGTDPGSPLSIGPGTSYPVTEASFPAPPLNVLYSSSVDTEGELPVSRRHGNRTITLKVEMDESGANDTLLNALQGKFAKFQREGGTLKRTRKDGTTIRIYDIVAADGWDPVYDFKYVLGNSSEVVMSLPAKPYARGSEVDLGDNVDTTNASLSFSESGVAGDVTALGRLLIDNDGSVSWSEVLWGIETDQLYTHTTSSGSGALFYEAESRTLLSGSTLTTFASGVTGGASNNLVVSQQLPTTAWMAVLSTGTLTHVGTFRFYARIRITGLSGNNDVYAALQWGQGDLRTFTQNESVTVPADQTARWFLADLGLVNLIKPSTGAMRWEGRIVGKASTGPHTLQIDHIALVPADRGFGQASAITLNTPPSTFAALDNFNQTAGNLAGKTLEVGGTWAGAGSATDFTVNATSKTAERSITTDADYKSGRFAIAGTATFTDVTSSVILPASSTSNSTQGVFARYIDTSNYLACWYRAGSSSLQIHTQIAGVTTILVSQLIADPAGEQLAFTVTNDGTWRASVGGVFVANGQDDTLATGGTLASGKVGFYDAQTTPGTLTRNYDSYWAAATGLDAAAYAGRSIEVRHNAVERQDSAGVGWQRVAYTGAYLRVPRSGAEGRSVRAIVIPARSPFVNGIARHDLPNSISARLFATPRYL